MWSLVLLLQPGLIMLMLSNAVLVIRNRDTDKFEVVIIIYSEVVVPLLGAS